MKAERTIRVDAAEKAAGKTRYCDDLPFDGLHAVLLRSTVAAGEIESISFDPDFDFSDLTIVDHRDIEGRNVNLLLTDDQPFLAEKEVHYIGEPILLLAHRDLAAARKALRHITVRYRERTPLLSMEASLAGEELIYGKDNLFHQIHLERGERPSDPELLSLEKCYSTPHQEQLYLETQRMLALYRDGDIKIIGSMQCPFSVAAAVKVLAGREVEVEQAPTGGAFGGKEDYPSLMASWVYLLSRKAKADVKLLLDRNEDLAFTTKRHPAKLRYRSRFDRSGKLHSLDIDITIDGGACVTLSPVVLSRAVLHAAGFYDIPHIRLDARAVATNTPPNGAFRGFGAPQAIFGIERHIDDIARYLGSSPAELRARNLPDSKTVTLTGATIEEAGALRRLFEKSRLESDFDRLYRQKRPWHGVGMALFMHGGGYTGNGEIQLASKVWLKLHADGIVEIRIGSVEMGQGSMSALMEIVARELRLPLSHIRYHTPNTAEVSDSGPTVASRTVMIVGALLREAAGELRQSLGEYRDEEEFSRRVSASLTGGGRSDFYAGYHKPDGIVWDEAHFFGNGYDSYSLGCYVAEVAVDPVDYSVKVTRLYACNDVGEVIDHVMAEGQVEGGVLQGIGYALYERLVHEKGRVRNRSLSDYTAAMAADTGEILVHFMGEERAAGGLGELPMDGPAAAVVNALVHALERDLDAIPVTAEKIAEVLDVDQD